MIPLRKSEWILHTLLLTSVILTAKLIFEKSFVFFFSRDQCRFAQAPFKKLNILPLVIYMVDDYSFFGSTVDFVIKNEHLGWKHLYLQKFPFFFLRSESNLPFPHPAFWRSGYRLSNSTVIFLPDVSDVWRRPNPVKPLNVEKNTKTNKITIAKNQKLATQNFLFNMHIHFPFGNI
jgi:hypothetical protein